MFGELGDPFKDIAEWPKILMPNTPRMPQMPPMPPMRPKFPKPEIMPLKPTDKPRPTPVKPLDLNPFRPNHYAKRAGPLYMVASTSSHVE